MKAKIYKVTVGDEIHPMQYKIIWEIFVPVSKKRSFCVNEEGECFYHYEPRGHFEEIKIDKRTVDAILAFLKVKDKLQKEVWLEKKENK